MSAFDPITVLETLDRPVAPSEAFSAALWQKLEAQISESAASPTPRSGWFGRWSVHPRSWSRLQVAFAVVLLLLLLAGCATATYLLLRDEGGIALGGGAGPLTIIDSNAPGLHTVASCAAWHPTEGPCVIHQPAWSPDGAHIAFVMGREGASSGVKDFSLYVAAADGSDLRRLAFCGLCANSSDGQHLGWSPDGKWIAFTRDTGRDQQSIWIVAASGGEPRRVTRCPVACGDYKPGWSADGHRLVFDRSEGTPRAGGIYTVRSDGSGLRVIAKGGFNQDPSWSPDGRRIAFDNMSRGIEVVDADGSRRRVLTPGPWPDRNSPGHPVWSPDGHRLLFLITPRGPRGVYRAELWTMNADGTDQKRLYHSKCCIDSPIWSPTGRLIAFGNDPDTGGGTFEINADGSGLRRLSTTPYPELSWQPRVEGKK